jgi:hypothetical protein
MEGAPCSDEFSAEDDDLTDGSNDFELSSDSGFDTESDFSDSSDNSSIEGGLFNIDTLLDRCESRLLLVGCSRKAVSATLGQLQSGRAPRFTLGAPCPCLLLHRPVAPVAGASGGGMAAVTPDLLAAINAASEADASFLQRCGYDAEQMAAADSTAVQPPSTLQDIKQQIASQALELSWPDLAQVPGAPYGLPPGVSTRAEISADLEAHLVNHILSVPPRHGCRENLDTAELELQEQLLQHGVLPSSSFTAQPPQPAQRFQLAQPGDSMGLLYVSDPLLEKAEEAIRCYAAVSREARKGTASGDSFVLEALLTDMILYAGDKPGGPEGLEVGSASLADHIVDGQEMVYEWEPEKTHGRVSSIAAFYLSALSLEIAPATSMLCVLHAWPVMLHAWNGE